MNINDNYWVFFEETDTYGLRYFRHTPWGQLKTLSEKRAELDMWNLNAAAALLRSGRIEMRPRPLYMLDQVASFRLNEANIEEYI